MKSLAALVLWLAPTILGSEPPDAWRLLVYSIRLLPIEGSFTADDIRRGALRDETMKADAYDRALRHRMDLVQACVDATEVRAERYICVKVARYESAFREDVGRCQINGKAGDKGAWQIVPRNASEEERLCKDLVTDARFHVERVRESRSACRHLPKWDQLAMYARGSCDSDEGRSLSRHRFPTDAEIKRLETERW